MPRYYFDIRNGGKVFSDEDGIELSSVDEVHQEAFHAIAEMARDAIRENPVGSRHLRAIEVRDDNGPVLTIKFHWTVERHKQSY